MKSFFKLIVIIFTMVLSFWVEPASLQAQPVDSTAYIKDIKQETVMLVSNNIFGGEICSYEEENSNSINGSSCALLSFGLEDNFLIKNKTQLKGCFIHNLSTNSKKVHLIRAP